MKIKTPSFIECYRKIISIPSISSIDPSLDQSNESLVHLLANWFYDLGFKITLSSIPNTRNKFNLLATTGKGLGGLLLSGHTDTVPCDPNFWKYDPFILTESDNKFYGLGTVDMKGFFALLINVLSNIDISKLRKPLYILATADEETTMIGAKNFSKLTALKPDIAIIGEPTSLKLISSHRGHISITVRIRGESGHSSDMSSINSVNAIDIAQKIIYHLSKLRKIVIKNHHDNKSDSPYLIVNFGSIKGGDLSNRICSYCELHLDIRFLPNFTINDINKFINQALKPIRKIWLDRIYIDQLHQPIPAYKCSNSSSIQQIQQLLGKKLEIVNYCTEAPFIQNICPTLIFGPGSINQAHQPNEFMDISFIKPAYENIFRIVHYFCN
ncbi:acetylornithine deacetylase [Candidatus Pantoea edessiphila]|uniref:Acetylornithine deacetylase n=1 Tax=Candidatus Pantoea edessiphila TaxID=2044610 RepID=A0A2P5T296_9GAMM|nr:acetylornithine deacetylase [Candidatus Pantoea edessiphila]PPI88698.1 acetylornithine deacetylase [Candidatus Pantoea edessiphila]